MFNQSLENAHPFPSFRLKKKLGIQVHKIKTILTKKKSDHHKTTGNPTGFDTFFCGFFSVSVSVHTATCWASVSCCSISCVCSFSFTSSNSKVCLCPGGFHVGLVTIAIYNSPPGWWLTYCTLDVVYIITYVKNWVIFCDFLLSCWNFGNCNWVWPEMSCAFTTSPFQSTRALPRTTGAWLSPPRQRHAVVQLISRNPANHLLSMKSYEIRDILHM